jgi:3',5'-cyclic AMP phosphodiesterase CpdA
MGRTKTNAGLARLPLAAAALLLAGCFEYSAHAIPQEDRHRDVHRKSLERLSALPAPTPLRFAVVGDAQLKFEHAADAVEALRRRGDLAFVVQIGDFTHFGIAPEYELMNDLFRELAPLPYFVAVGNHDVLANGGDIYRSMFGIHDFAFTYQGVRFVFLDTNSLEAGMDGTVPDLGFLAAQLAPSPDHDRAIVFAHIDPLAPDFDERLREPWFAILRDGRVAASFHGHAHEHRRFEQQGVPHVIVDDVRQRAYALATQRPDGGFDVELVRF